MSAVKIFLRNDDVNNLDAELLEFWRIVCENRACADMAVEPANVVAETVSWLRELKQNHPDQISIITHGYDHVDKVPGMGEFGGRTYEDQIKDVRAGRELMDKNFGDDFFAAFTCPRGGHNQATIRCMDETGYKVFSSYHNVYAKNKILYGVGHLLRRTHLLGKRVSHHMQRIPGSGLMDISMSMSLIKRYFSDDDCEFPTLDYLKERLDRIRATGQTVIGVTVHHRYHRRPEHMQLIADALRMFRDEGCEFSTLERLYKELT
ncbi:polysaccharide deacetylase family protein [Thiorhodovibrio frisius]|uniref:Xylanase/chitin deacetylase n=1 Tax=Thiorhodovibrio frisius TaxID=631362 RepID=H8YYD3_9GAMM|nr:hypothetical protein [Thiorhodovibrio frisius]EIC23459.1 hypothetical protein Thi970DRAFT_01127 [Thiorhodovibrio frisius]WPL23458.1 hypothetical protein Thiofri_03643 [Thiorhodovibrio frisius]